MERENKNSKKGHFDSLIFIKIQKIFGVIYLNIQLKKIKVLTKNLKWSQLKIIKAKNEGKFEKTILLNR